MSVKKSQKKEKAGLISDEEIQKAFDQLQSVADDFNKGNEDDFEEDEEDVEEEEVEEEDSEEDDDDEVEKGNDDDMEDDDEDDEDEDDEEEEEAPKKKVKKAAKKVIKKSSTGNAMTSHSKSVKEGVEVSEFLKGLVTDFDSTVQRQNKVLGNMAIVMKGMVDEINDLKASLGEPRQRKSKLSKDDVQERFSKGNDDDMNGTTTKKIGLRSGHKAIVKALDALTFNERGINSDFANALTLYEASHQISPSIQKAVEDQLGAKIDLNL